jgi:hypothetical protein
MDVSDASYYIFNEKGNKGSQMGHTKKIFKKKKVLNNFVRFKPRIKVYNDMNDIAFFKTDN